MRYLFSLLLVIVLFSCKRDEITLNAPKVDIYLLKSFSFKVDQTTSPATISISDAVLSDTLLLRDQDILLYTQSSATFKSSKNIKTIIKDFGSNRGFAVTVNKDPIYFGLFHPSYLSSLVYGLSTIDPITYPLNNNLIIHYEFIAGNTYLQQFDKRNDARIIDALKQTGRVR